MALRHESVPVNTIGGIDFVNLQPSDISPLVSKCEIKVFYLGQNRNGSYFDRTVAENMAKTLRGVPIVGAWRDDAQDFSDHGEVITIEDGEVSFSCKTVPYGFTDPNGDIWFQDFEDELDEFGNKTVHTYLMTTGYLWVGQYPELQSLIDGGGKGESMELDGDSMRGHWATDTAKDIDFFIVDDATFTKLCILGDDVEPCMEGSSVVAEPTNNYSLNDFNMSLYSMMKELRDSREGGSDMTENAEGTVEQEPVADEFVNEDAPDVVAPVEETSFADKKDDEPADDASDDDDSVSDDDADDSDDRKKPSADHTLELENELAGANAKIDDVTAQFADVSAKLDELQKKFDELQSEAEGLREFKAQRDKADKDALIAKYHMLSDEDKADVIEHENEYTLAEIESKLALAYVRNNVDFDTVDGKPDDNDGVVTTFSLGDIDAGDEEIDPMVEALREASF